MPAGTAVPRSLDGVAIDCVYNAPHATVID